MIETTLETDIASFVAGLLAARDQALAHVLPTPYGLAITYPPHAERWPEAFAFRPEGLLDDLEPPFTLHVVDGNHAAPSDTEGQTRVLMVRLLDPAPMDGGDAIEVTDLALMAALDALPGFDPPSQDLRCVQFAALDAQGAPVAAARSGMGAEQDIVIDNLVTRDPTDRAGAEAVLAKLLATAAARGQKRALALVTPDHRASFDVLGFAALAQVVTFAP